MHIPLFSTILFLAASQLVLAQDTGTPPGKYFYPQPPLPKVQAVRDPAAWKLDPSFQITNVSTTREYYWTLSPAAAAPDGYPRKIYAINNMFPGPLIEANEGDEIVVHLTNNLDIPMTIHWHGMFQNGTAFMDGVPGVSQCPIGTGVTFTYRFKVTNQYGSYWWHSHYGNTLADGIVGGLIIHSTRDPVVRGVDFDEEVVVMVQDWMDLQSESIVEAMHSNEGYRGSAGPPQGNAILINGLGRTNCSNDDIQDHSLACSPPASGEIKVTAGKRTRLRILNTGSFGMYRVSVDSHPFELVELDDTAVHGPTGMHEVQVAVGQRASIIINANQGKVGDGFFLRANIVTACFGLGGKVQTGLAILRYVDGQGYSPNTEVPDTKAWDDLLGRSGACRDIDEDYDIKPRYAIDAATDILQTHVMSSRLGTFVDKDGHKLGGFGFNNVTFRAQIGYPLISQLQAGEEIDNRFVAHATFDRMGGGDLIVNNLDKGISHPYHLHGKPFFLVARGKGSLTAKQWEGMKANTARIRNPLRRDVLEITGGSWAVLRVYTDLPGVWPLHCHIGWHLAEGKLAAIVYQPDKVRQMKQPQEWKALCQPFGHDEIGPAKRSQTEFEKELETYKPKENNEGISSRITSRRRGLTRSGPKDQ